MEDYSRSLVEFKERFATEEACHQYLTAGSIFHDSRKPMRLWFEAMWHITSQIYGANALGLQRVLSSGS
jgi:hypothetical protein